MQAPCEDIVPGVIWSRLIGDVFTATAAAVELLIEWLERPPAPHPDWSDVRERFRRLHAGFTTLAERDRRWPRPPAGQPEPPAHLRPWPEARLVKVASSFRMPPAREWCDFPMEFEFQSMPLARHHADAEYLFSRHLSGDFLALAEQAGAALPPTAPDAPVLFTRPTPEEQLPPDIIAGWSVGCSGLDPNPVARWVRFVFNSLRATDPGGDSVAVQFLDPPPDRRNPFPVLYGYAALPNGFFAASARAIERAGLLPAQPVLTPSDVGSDAGETPQPPAAMGGGGGDARAAEVETANITPKRNDGKPSADRQSDILAAIRAAGTPLTRPELVEAMRWKKEGKLGHNLAWLVSNGVLINIEGRGYWPADLPPPA
jgi:hypothetical protein